MSIRIYFNPLNRACKNVTGAVKQGQSLQLNVFLLKNDVKTDEFGLFSPKEADCLAPDHDAFLSFNRDGESAQSFSMQKTTFGWSIKLSVPKIGLYFYTFWIDGQGFVSCNEMQMGELTENPRGFSLTVCSKNYKTPEWFKGGVMYQIFPDRFYKEGTMPDIKGRVARNDWGGIPSYRPNEQGKVLNNDFFGGNFKGVMKKLPYLEKLGVTVIYFNPVFEAASNHRYDTSDYMKIDPLLGTEEDFKNLLETAKNKGISVILDGVFNHTGDNSVYFNKYGKYPSVGAYQSKNSPYYSWYSFEEFPDKYASWWGIDILPEVNEESEEYQEFIFGENGVLKKWLSFGIGGYRLDVADELPDFFLKNLRKSVKESNSDAMIIGEVWEDASNKIAYSKRREYLQGYELDSVMNYPLKEAIISYIKSENASILLQTIRTLIDHYPKQTVDCLMNILGTHDTARILTVLGGIYCQNKDEMASESAYLSEKAKATAIEKLKLAAILQFTLPGVPCVYYGDENGAEGHIDPFCRQCFDWDNLNEDLISFYEKLGNMRKCFREIFKDGDLKTLFLEDGLIFYKRKKSKDEIYIYVNNSGKPYQFELSKKYKNVLTNEIFENSMQIKPYSYGIFIQKKPSKV